MRNILEQIIVLYPNDTLVVSMDSGDNVSGRPGTLKAAPGSGFSTGVFTLLNNQGVVQDAVSVCRIAAVKLTSSAYNNSIKFLPAPTDLPNDCCTSCEEAIRGYLAVGKTGVGIKAGGQTVATGTVRKDEFGMVVVVGPNDSNPAFISTCEIEVMTI